MFLVCKIFECLSSFPQLKTHTHLSSISLLSKSVLSSDSIVFYGMTVSTNSRPLLHLYRDQSIDFQIANQLTGFHMLATLVFDPFYASGLFLYPLKTSEHLRFSGFFTGY